MKYLLLTAMLSGGFVASQAQVYPGQTAPAMFPVVTRLSALGTYKSTEATRSSAKMQVPGRIVNYRWDAVTNRWVNGEVVTATYNAVGYPISELTADSATNQSIRRLTNTFSTPTVLLSTTTENWDGSAWQNNYRTQNSYNKGQDRITERLSQRWSSGVWQNIGRIVSAYNRYDMDTMLLNQDWVNARWVTQPTSSQSYIIYNGSNQYIEIYRNYFDINRNDFKPYNKSMYAYSSASAKSPIAEVEQLLQNGVYVNNTRFLTTYDVQSRVSLQEKQSWVGGAWVPLQRINYTYLNNSPGSSFTIQQYQQNGWVNDLTITNSFDAYGNQIGYLYELWKNGAWETQIDDRRLLRYDADNNVVRSVRQVYNIYNTTAKTLINESLSTYSNYRQIMLGVNSSVNLAAHTVVYPNPANRSITLILPDFAGAVKNVDVINALGQIVQTYTFRRNAGQRNYQLDLWQLPTGSYSLRVQTPEGVVVKRIVLQ